MGQFKCLMEFQINQNSKSMIMMSQCKARVFQHLQGNFREKKEIISLDYI